MFHKIMFEDQACGVMLQAFQFVESSYKQAIQNVALAIVRKKSNADHTSSYHVHAVILVCPVWVKTRNKD